MSVEETVEACAKAASVQNWVERGYSPEQADGFWNGRDGATLNKTHYRRRAEAALSALKPGMLLPGGNVVVSGAELKMLRKVVRMADVESRREDDGLNTHSMKPFRTQRRVAVADYRAMLAGEADEPD